jgi:two-component system phosphate regulon response regulator PhoB
MRKRVLVLDDQPYLRDIQALLLKEAGYATTAIGDCAEALGRLDDLRPDLIVLDMAMPGMDGRQFLYHLRRDARWADVPVIITTGRLAEEFETLATDSVDVLAKPFSDATLIERVRRLVGEPEPRAVVKT